MTARKKRICMVIDSELAKTIKKAKAAEARRSNGFGFFRMEHPCGCRAVITSNC